MPVDITETTIKYDPRIDYRPYSTNSLDWKKKRGYKYRAPIVAFVPHFDGEVDGKPHDDEIQMSSEKYRNFGWDIDYALCECHEQEKEKVGRKISLLNRGIFHSYYVVPTKSRIDILKAWTKEKIEEGADAIEIVEPEIWAWSGYSDAFKREWKAYYGSDWEDPSLSVSARLKAEKLKSYLLTRLFRAVFEFAKSLKSDILCYVGPHGIIDYASIKMTSVLGNTHNIEEMDGIVNHTFQTAVSKPFIDAGARVCKTVLQSYVNRSHLDVWTRATRLKMINSFTPVGDAKYWDWDDYRSQFEQNVVATLMFETSTHFQIVQPEGPLLGIRGYGKEAGSKHPWSVDLPVSETYKSEFCTLMNVLKDAENFSVDRDTAIAVPVSDTIMWGRVDPLIIAMDAFYALTIPLLKRGVHLDVLPIEISVLGDFLEAYEVMLLTYESWFPQEKRYHDKVVEWVHEGGSLILFGGSPFENTPDWWWSKDGFETPLDAILEDLGVEVRSRGVVASNVLTADGRHPLADRLGNRLSIPRCRMLNVIDAKDVTTVYTPMDEDNPSIFEKSVGSGRVVYVGVPTESLAHSSKGAEVVRGLVEYVCRVAGVKHVERDALQVRRGPYLCVYAVRPLTVKGEFIDLFDPALSLVRNITLEPNDYALLYDITDKMKKYGILYSNSTIEEDKLAENGIVFETEGPTVAIGVTVLHTPEPKELTCRAAGSRVDMMIDRSYNREKEILTVRYKHRETAVNIDVRW